MKFDFWSVSASRPDYARLLRALLLCTTIAVTWFGAPVKCRAAPDGFVTETFNANEFSVRISYPADFTKSKKYGGFVTLVGPPQDDESLPSVFVRSYLVAEGRPLASLVRFLEDRYRRIDGYSVETLPESDDAMLMHRNYHYPGSELAVDERVGFRKNGEHLLEIRCVSSALSAQDYASVFDRVIRSIRFVPFGGVPVLRDVRVVPERSVPVAKGKTATPTASAAGEERGTLKINLAIDLIEKARYEKAQLVLEPLLSRDPENFDLNLMMGKARIGRLDFAGAVPHFAKLVEKRPDSLTWHNFHIDVLIQAKRFAEAERAARAASRVQGTVSERATLEQNLGNLHMKRGRPAEALAAFEKGLSIHPDHAGIRFNLAVLLESAGRRTEALLHAREAVKADPAFLDARLLLGRILLGEKEWSAAMMQFLFVSKSRTEDVEALSGLALAYDGLGMSDKAAAARAKRRSLAPSAAREGK